VLVEGAAAALAGSLVVAEKVPLTEADELPLCVPQARRAVPQAPRAKEEKRER
jgi:hypothetical protein